MSYTINTSIREGSGPQDRRMQIRVKSDLLEPRPSPECQIDGPLYLDKIGRWVSSFDFVFAFPHSGTSRSTGLSFGDHPGDAHADFSMENQRGFGNPCHRVGIGFEPRPFVRVKVVESYTVQKCNTDKTRPVPYANKFAPKSTRTHRHGLTARLGSDLEQLDFKLEGRVGGDDWRESASTIGLCEEIIDQHPTPWHTRSNSRLT